MPASLLCTLCRHAVMFQLYDLDRDGYVSRDELFFILRTLMGHAVSESHLDKVKPCPAAEVVSVGIQRLSVLM
jgi:hypothetical protein